jgi:hypothetical protein
MAKQTYESAAKSVGSTPRFSTFTLNKDLSSWDYKAIGFSYQRFELLIEKGMMTEEVTFAKDGLWDVRVTCHGVTASGTDHRRAVAVLEARLNWESLLKRELPSGLYGIEISDDADDYKRDTRAVEYDPYPSQGLSAGRRGDVAKPKGRVTYLATDDMPDLVFDQPVPAAAPLAAMPAGPEIVVLAPARTSGSGPTYALNSHVGATLAAAYSVSAQANAAPATTVHETDVGRRVTTCVSSPRLESRPGSGSDTDSLDVEREAVGTGPDDGKAPLLVSLGDKQYRCTICDTQISGYASVDQHFKGRLHKNQVEATRLLSRFSSATISGEKRSSGLGDVE